MRRLAAAGAVVLAVLGGVWVAGGLLTNDFVLAAGLTAAWMALAGAACALVAWRRPALRVAVLGAYLLTAAAVGVFLARAELFDHTVHEDVARAAPARVGAAKPGGGSRPVNVLLARGRFGGVAHAGAGVASVIRRARGDRVLTLTSFAVANGPDLRLYLVAGPARSEAEVRDRVDLGALKGNRGDQQYELPPGLDLRRYRTVVVWCRAFTVLFARAPLA